MVWSEVWRGEGRVEGGGVRGLEGRGVGMGGWGLMDILDSVFLGFFVRRDEGFLTIF
jgi:hypothetical protein